MDYVNATDLAVLECSEVLGIDQSAEAHRNQHRLVEYYSTDHWRDYLPKLKLFNAKSREMKSIFWTRLLVAGSAGLALIAPMLIMTLHPTKLTSLLTASLFIIAVAVILAGVMEDAQNKDIVAATAAYAAVLVVFVGTAMTPGA